MRRCSVARVCLSVPRSPSACWAQRLGMLGCLSPTPLSSSTSVTGERRGERGPLGLIRSLLLSPGRHRTCSLPLARSPPLPPPTSLLSTPPGSPLNFTYFFFLHYSSSLILTSSSHSHSLRRGRTHSPCPPCRIFVPRWRAGSPSSSPRGRGF